MSEHKSKTDEDHKNIDQFRTRLKRMINARLDGRLKGRIDPSDIVQETMIEAHDRRDEFDADKMPYYLWLRMIATRNLIDVQRRHLGTQKRDAGREVSIHRQVGPRTHSVSLAAQLIGRLTTASRAAIRLELRDQLHDALEQMDDLDREVLSLRHFEQLTNAEVAHLLEISPNAASNRYIRALERMRRIIESKIDWDDSHRI